MANILISIIRLLDSAQMGFTKTSVKVLNQHLDVGMEGVLHYFKCTLA